MEKIIGIDVQDYERSKRILNIKLNDEIIEKLIFPFNKFDLTVLELKPFKENRDLSRELLRIRGKFFEI